MPRTTQRRSLRVREREARKQDVLLTALGIVREHVPMYMPMRVSNYSAIQAMDIALAPLPSTAIAPLPSIELPYYRSVHDAITDEFRKRGPRKTVVLPGLHGRHIVLNRTPIQHWELRGLFRGIADRLPTADAVSDLPLYLIRATLADGATLAEFNIEHFLMMAVPRVTKQAIEDALARDTKLKKFAAGMRTQALNSPYFVHIGHNTGQLRAVASLIHAFAQHGFEPDFGQPI